MIRMATIGVAILALCCITFVVIPSAFGFEDYITDESPVQEGDIENDSPAKDDGGSYYDVPAYEADEKDTIGDKETVTQEEDQETGQNLDDKGQEETE